MHSYPTSKYIAWFFSATLKSTTSLNAKLYSDYDQNNVDLTSDLGAVRFVQTKTYSDSVKRVVLHVFGKDPAVGWDEVLEREKVFKKKHEGFYVSKKIFYN